jgi:hypothetical protein
MCQLQDTSLSHTLAKDKHRILGDRYNVLNLFTSKDGFNSCRMTEGYAGSPRKEGYAPPVRKYSIPSLI